MEEPIKLVSIPGESYSDYRYRVIFQGYKWDPQVEDHNTVSRHALLMDRDTAHQLECWAEQLSRETVEMEEAFPAHLALAGELGLPPRIKKALGAINSYCRDSNVRVMRFDFHPTDTGWALSEVNSDVPGGFAEASVLPEIAAPYFDGYGPGKNLAQNLLKAFQARVEPGGAIAFVHATSYADDRQVMQFMGDRFQALGYRAVYAAPDHIRWVDQKAVSIVEGREGPVDGIVRFFPLEWLVNLPRYANWQGYYRCLTPSCNHPIAMFTQSKRLPLVWDRLGVEVPTWKALLPETLDPKTLGEPGEDWIYKPALGRVGEGISIREAIPQKERMQVEKAARRSPKNWVAQRRFHSRALPAGEGESYHLCVGVFTVNGKSAGFYGRISPYPRIDARAKDIPLLVAKEG